MLLGRLPRLEQVVIEPHGVDAGNGRLRIGIGGKQNAAGVGIQLQRFDEKLCARHARHPLVDEEQRHGRAALFQLPRGLERLIPRACFQNTVCGCEVMAQVPFNGIQDLRLIVDRQNDRF
jgi:hypothetical protein